MVLLWRTTSAEFQVSRISRFGIPVFEVVFVLIFFLENPKIRTRSIPILKYFVGTSYINYEYYPNAFLMGLRPAYDPAFELAP